MTDATTTGGEVRSAIDRALAAGVSRREIFAMVAAMPMPAPFPQDEIDPGSITYDETPEGLIALVDAVEKYGVGHDALAAAVNQGLLPAAGWVEASGDVSQSQQLVPEAALRHYLNLPPSPEDQERAIASGSDDSREYSALSEAMITLPGAARKYGIPVDHLQRWLRNARLTRVGYLRDSSGERGSVLLMEADVLALITDA